MEFQPMIKANLSTSVKGQLYKYIQSLTSKSDTKLPPESVLSTQLGVSRMTIRRALDELEQEGVVLRIHGRGTFVNPEAISIQPNLMPGAEFRKLIESCGYQSAVKIIGIRKIIADTYLTETLKLEPETELYEVEKAYYADNELAIISIDRFSCKLIGVELTADILKEKSIFDILITLGGCFIARDKIQIESVLRSKINDSRVCREQMDCDSVLVFHGINYNQENQPVMCDTEYYNTNIIKFNLIRVKTP